jgi:hypothetical protein
MAILSLTTEFWGGGLKVSNVVRDGIPHTFELAG